MKTAQSQPPVVPHRGILVPQSVVNAIQEERIAGLDARLGELEEEAKAPAPMGALDSLANCRLHTAHEFLYQKNCPPVRVVTQRGKSA